MLCRCRHHILQHQLSQNKRKIHWTRFDRIVVLYHIFLVKWTSAYNFGLTDTAFVLVFATLEFGTQYIVEWYSVMVYAPKVVHPSEKNQSHQQKMYVFIVWGRLMNAVKLYLIWTLVFIIFVTCKQSSIAHDKLVPVGKSIVTRLS